MPDLTQLGSKTPIPASPDDTVIECIPYDGSPIVVRFQIPEFTSRCPITSAPDFARIIIDYVPSEKLIESKSLKLFAGSFRNEGIFHEFVAREIGTRLWMAAEPKWMRVAAFFYARGGIPLDIFWMDGEITKCENVFIPPLDLAPFMGR